MRWLLLPLALSLACDGDDDDDGPGSDAGPADTGIPPDAGDTVCEMWIVQYDLSMGSQFDIRNTPFNRGDATNDIGPGMLRLRYLDRAGALGNGPVTMLEYHMEMDFTVADVVTDVTLESGPDECGVASGVYDGDQIDWSTPLRGYHSFGTITCNAGELVCSFAGLPNGTPETQDSTHDQELRQFVFGSTTATVPPNGFVMGYVQVPTDESADTFLRLTGREVGRNCVRAPTCP